LSSHFNQWFVAKDIATMLEYSNTNKAITDHIDKEDMLTYNFLVKMGVTNRYPHYFSRKQS